MQSTCTGFSSTQSGRFSVLHLGARARIGWARGPAGAWVVSDATHGHRHVVACANACVVGARGWTCVASVHAGRTRGVEVPRAASVRRSERLVKYGLFC